MKYTILIVLTVIGFGCKKEKDRTGNVTFFQSNFDVKNTALYIDGKRIDVLNSCDTCILNPSCGEKRFPYVITSNLPIGKHNYCLKWAGGSSDTFSIDVKYPCEIIKIEP